MNPPVCDSCGLTELDIENTKSVFFREQLGIHWSMRFRRWLCGPCNMQAREVMARLVS